MTPPDGYHPGKQLLVINAPRQGIKDFAVWMGMGSATITSGHGGWQATARPDDIAFTEWLGMEPIRQDIPILLDGVKYNESQEEELALLLRLGRLPNKPPPVFRMNGGIHYRHKRWVMESIEFGDSMRRKRDGRLIRQHLVFHVMEYIDPDVIKRRKKKHKKKDDKTRHRATVKRAKEGDTLIKMAVRFYHDRSKWKLIRKANPKLPKDPRKKLDKGTKVKIPAG